MALSRLIRKHQSTSNSNIRNSTENDSLRRREL